MLLLLNSFMKPPFNRAKRGPSEVQILSPLTQVLSDHTTRYDHVEALLTQILARPGKACFNLCLNNCLL